MCTSLHRGVETMAMSRFGHDSAETSGGSCCCAVTTNEEARTFGSAAAADAAVSDPAATTGDGNGRSDTAGDAFNAPHDAKCHEAGHDGNGRTKKRHASPNPPSASAQITNTRRRGPAYKPKPAAAAAPPPSREMSTVGPASGSAARIRSRFLRSVGIVEPSAPSSSSSSSGARPLVRRRPPAREPPPLRRSFGGGGADDTASTCSDSSSLSSASVEATAAAASALREKRRPRRSVTFSATSTCVLIPSRRSYSPRIRAALWTAPGEMRLAVERNAVEFASEGWDWTRALEEEQMYVNPETGEHIHPIHIKNYLAWMQQERLRRTEALRRMEALRRAPSMSRHRELFLQKSRAAARSWSQFA